MKIYNLQKSFLIVYDVISNTDLVNMIILPLAICDVVKLTGGVVGNLSRSIATSSLGDYFISLATWS